MRMFDFAREILKRSTENKKGHIPWLVAEKDEMPICSFKTEIREVAEHFVERGCTLRVHTKGHVEIIGVGGNIVGRIYPRKEWGKFSAISVEYYAGVISMKGEEKLASHQKIRLMPTLILREWT
jgi:hypothetical protein